MSVTTPDEWFAWMWAQHARAVWAYAARRIGPDKADDVVSKTFLILWRRAEELKMPQSRGFTLGIARRVLADDYRSQARMDALVSRLTVAGLTEAQVSQPSVQRSLPDELVNRLAPEDLELLLLLVWDGLKPREIAVVLDISPGACRKRIFQARKRARQALTAGESAGQNQFLLLETGTE
jgi:RNA polymerase sigma-70 factor (ECF subfamily)